MPTGDRDRRTGTGGEVPGPWLEAARVAKGRLWGVEDPGHDVLIHPWVKIGVLLTLLGLGLNVISILLVSAF